MLPDLSIRATLNELMDAPDCDKVRLLRTIRQFSSINRWVGRYRTVLKKWVLADMLQHPDKEYHLVDLGAGGCDIDLWLLKAAERNGLNLRITACDIDPRTVSHARSEFGHVPRLEIKRMDVLKDLPDEPVDYVFANHFLHHLSENEIAALLLQWHLRVRRRMVFSDLLRSQAAYCGFSVFSLFYSKSFARADGLISIRRGFLPGELVALAQAAIPKTPFSVHSLQPGRLVLCIEGNPSPAT